MQAHKANQCLDAGSDVNFGPFDLAFLLGSWGPYSGFGQKTKEKPSWQGLLAAARDTPKCSAAAFLAPCLGWFQRCLHDKSEFTGMMLIPMSTGNPTTFMMIPLYDHFDVYEVFDDRRMRRPKCVLATTRDVEFPAGDPVRFAGILRKMEAKKETERQHSFYMEVCYYTRLKKTGQPL